MERLWSDSTGSWNAQGMPCSPHLIFFLLLCWSDLEVSDTFKIIKTGRRCKGELYYVKLLQLNKGMALELHPGILAELDKEEDIQTKYLVESLKIEQFHFLGFRWIQKRGVFRSQA